MALKVRPSSRITFEIRTQDPDTLAPIGGLPVFLDRLDQPAAAPVQVAGAQTDAQGRAEISATIPASPGSYRYRARTPGVAERYRSDTSSQVAIEVVE